MSGIYRDLTGQTFGRLSVLSLSSFIYSNGGRQWKCKCSCGNIIFTRADSLVRGHTLSCGCLNKEISSKQSYVSLVGCIFTRLTVIKRISNNTKEVKYLCSCSCGNTSFEVLGSSLKKGVTKSCGCLKFENNQKMAIERNKAYRLSRGHDPNIPMSSATEQYRTAIKKSTLRIDTLKRDNFCCILCKSKQKLQIHHIIPLNENYSLNLNMFNLITLCSDCHNNRAHPNKNTRLIDPLLQILFSSYTLNLF